MILLLLIDTTTDLRDIFSTTSERPSVKTARHFNKTLISLKLQPSQKGYVMVLLYCVSFSFVLVSIRSGGDSPQFTANITVNRKELKTNQKPRISRTSKRDLGHWDYFVFVRYKVVIKIASI